MTCRSLVGKFIIQLTEYLITELTIQPLGLVSFRPDEPARGDVGGRAPQPAAPAMNA